MVKMLVLFRIGQLPKSVAIPGPILERLVGDVFETIPLAWSEVLPSSHRGFVVELEPEIAIEFRDRAYKVPGGTAHFLNDQPVDKWLAAHGLKMR